MIPVKIRAVPIPKNRIRFYEKQLVDAFASLLTHSSDEKKSKFAVILGYLIVKQRLTAKQLQDLTKYSPSTVHNCLTMLELSNRIDKKLLSGTHAYEYSVPETMEKMITRVRLSYQQKIEATIRYHEILSQKVPVTHLLYSRIQEGLSCAKNLRDLLRYFDVTPKAILIHQNAYDQQEDHHLQDLIVKNMRIEDVEKEIISLYASSTNIDIRHSFSEPMKLIFGYLITRKTLTQKELQHLTKLSAGTISQNLNKLIQYELITRNGKTPRGHHRYQLLSISDSILRGFDHDIEKIISREQEFKEYKEEITDVKTNITQNKENNAVIKRYDILLTFIDSLLNMFVIYQRMHTRIDELLQHSSNNSS
ncbi:MAG: MarR family transcriptional regulator [Candidatus Odinarchaeota archaeon]